MFNILIINQKGGVGKTTIADELAFALERLKKSVSFVSTDAQGGSVHGADIIDDADFQIVDTAGVLTENLHEWCKAADMIMIPMLPSSRDLEPTLRTYQLATSSQTDARIGLIINGYFTRGILDRQLKEHLQSEKYLIWTEIPKTVSLPQAAAEGMSVSEYDKDSPATVAFENLATVVIQEEKRIRKEKK